jgi:hypothetical protein
VKHEDLVALIAAILMAAQDVEYRDPVGAIEDAEDLIERVNQRTK